MCLFICNYNSFHSRVRIMHIRYIKLSILITWIRQHMCRQQQISDNINTELNDIFVWLCVNKLALNVKKTKYMLFHYRQRDIGNLIPSLKINDEPVERVTEFNFLGLTIDETLSWHPHVQKISNKISRTLGIIIYFMHYYATYVQ